ncbi:MAG: hypothetical protein ACK4EY_07695 [Flavipsychrobacter sp.]
MSRSAYILTFDRDNITNYLDLHNGIVSIPEVITWFHYIKSSYILISSEPDATLLNSKLLAVMGKKRYLLIEVDLSNRNGRLPRDAWEWLRKQSDKLT